MNSYVILRDRDFSVALMPKCEYVVKSYQNKAQGGFGPAVIEAYGDKNRLFSLLDWIRCPVFIYDEFHSLINHSMIKSVKVYWDNIEYGIDIDTMFNKIATAYVADSQRKTTDWSEDTDSSGEYGIKELLISNSEVSDAKALQIRDTKLQALKYPIPKHKQSSSSRQNKAVIETESWMDTLDWMHYQQLGGKESYEVLGSGGREIGEDDRPKAAMSFQIESAVAWDAAILKVHAYKYPSDVPPVDNLILSIYSDSGGSPNALLASVTVAAADIPTSGDWIGGALSASVTLNPATTYHIVVERSGAVSTSAYYMVDTNRDNGYPRGSLKLYSTASSTWVDRESKGDMNFIITGNEETTAQITVLITTVGQFFTGTIIDDASGVYTLQYRDGDKSGYYELLKLLDTGTTNNRRLLCNITEERYLRVFEEPAKPTDMENAYKLDSFNQLYEPNGRKIPPSRCMVGVWCALKDVDPDAVELSKIANPSPFFIEEARYDASTNKYSITKTKDIEDVWDIGGIGDI